MFEISNDAADVSDWKEQRSRKSAQAVMPFRVNGNETSVEGYRIYPSHPLGSGKIFNGYDRLVEWMKDSRCVIVDGFSGVLWDDVEASIAAAMERHGARCHIIRTQDFLKSPGEIEKLVRPYLGERESVWGTKADISLVDFFDIISLKDLKEVPGSDCTVVLGTGASLLEWNVPLVYLDVPKNEIQYRMRAGTITNLGIASPDEPAHMYKHFYFVDWVVLSQHKERIKERITVHGDVQWERNINWMFRKDLLKGMNDMTRTVLRARPWFEPGAWGGQWMKERIHGLNRDAVNFAWSFELIVPENGLVFESDGYLLEVPFDSLMAEHSDKILGKHAGFFGTQFPIRFDFLDTWNGGNLSIQCHPSVKYIREQFGEFITQDETYYILDRKPGAKVYLGFQEGVDPAEFRKALEDSKSKGEEVPVEKYVQVFEADKHALYLIPNGTVHSAGSDNLVLEISSTPYIFTFKMYDWLRLDLNGEPRAINIEHAYKNLRFDLQGERVKDELIAKPRLLENQGSALTWHLPTHADHFYDVHRLEFEESMTVQTDESCNVLMLVDGESVAVQIGNEITPFAYAETFVIPASVGTYTLINNGGGKIKVVKAFIKNSIDHLKSL